MVQLNLISVTAILATISPLVDAASCANYGGNSMRYFLQTSEQLHWDLRNTLCNTNRCTNLQVCDLTAHSRYGSVRLYSKDVQYQRKDCWGATGNIITQCTRNWWKTGWWQLGDQFYQFYSSPNNDLKKRDDGKAPDFTWKDKKTGIIFEVSGWNVTDDSEHEEPARPVAEAVF
ncbi:hypothetical protein V8F20_004824 [Naviculisporaceae sp. PSN 640]